MGQLFNIAKGWSNYLKGETNPLERERAEKCRQCKHAVVGTYEKLMPDYSLSEMQGLKCDVCNCPLSTKIRCEDEECPLKKWCKTAKL